LFAAVNAEIEAEDLEEQLTVARREMEGKKR
jgi:hypothetical protein